jgi:hypothetical protein
MPSLVTQILPIHVEQTLCFQIREDRSAIPPRGS